MLGDLLLPPAPASTAAAAATIPTTTTTSTATPAPPCILWAPHPAAPRPPCELELAAPHPLEGGVESRRLVPQRAKGCNERTAAAALLEDDGEMRGLTSEISGC